jgi:hypothetical protein
MRDIIIYRQNALPSIERISANPGVATACMSLIKWSPDARFAAAKDAILRKVSKPEFARTALANTG